MPATLITTMTGSAAILFQMPNAPIICGQATAMTLTQTEIRAQPMYVAITGTLTVMAVMAQPMGPPVVEGHQPPWILQMPLVKTKMTTGFAVWEPNVAMKPEKNRATA